MAQMGQVASQMGQFCCLKKGVDFLVVDCHFCDLR